MVESRRRPRFLFEAPKPIRVRSKLFEQNLERHLTPKLQILSAINGSHRARTNRPYNLVRT